MVSCAEESREEPRGNIIEALMADGRRTLDPFIERLNMEILWTGAEEAEGVIYVDENVLNPYGTVHGGCLMALADSVAGHNMLAAGKLCVTQTSTVNFLRPANGKRVYCRSKIQKLGRQVSVVSIEQSDEEGRLLTTGTITFNTTKDVKPHIIEPLAAGNGREEIRLLRD